MKNKRLKFNSGELVYYKDFDKLNTQTKFSTDKYGKVNYNINTGTDTTRLNLNKTTLTNVKIIKNILTNIIPHKINLKLPNDLEIMNKKVCGILQEIIYKDEIKFLIIGVGININSSPKLKEYETTYINKYNNKINRSKMVHFIKNKFENKYSYYA